MPVALEVVMEFLAGRSVAIVGNASSLLKGDHGPFIDSHDIVIRMNRGVPIDGAAQGLRTDVCCFSAQREIGDALDRAAPRFAVWMSPKFREEYDGRAGVSFYPEADWRSLRGKLRVRPSVGAMTVDLVSRSAARTVSIFGFDFKRTGTFYQAAAHSGPHDFAAESRYVLGMARARSWRFVELGQL